MPASLLAHRHLRHRGRKRTGIKALRTTRSYGISVRSIRESTATCPSGKAAAWRSHVRLAPIAWDLLLNLLLHLLSALLNLLRALLNLLSSLLGSTLPLLLRRVLELLPDTFFLRGLLGSLLAILCCHHCGHHQGSDKNEECSFCSFSAHFLFLQNLNSVYLLAAMLPLVETFRFLGIRWFELQKIALRYLRRSRG